MFEVSYSEACERNKYAILDVIESHLVGRERVLEIGSGTGQHAEYFAAEMPGLKWQTSDRKECISALEARVRRSGVENIYGPIVLDVRQQYWLKEGADPFDVVFSANTLHIMSWCEVERFFTDLPSALTMTGQLIVYGPFKYEGQFTSASNQQFDQMLRQRDPLSGIRDFEAVNELAAGQGLALVEDRAMPANNQCLVWRRSGRGDS